MNTLFRAHLRRSLLIRCIFLTTIVITPTAKRLATQTDVTSRPQAVTNSLAIKPIFEKRLSTIPTSEASSHNPYAHSSARERHDVISSDNVPDDVITTSSFSAPEETTISSSIFDLPVAKTATSTREETTPTTEDKTTPSRKEGTTKSTKQGTTTSTQKITVTFPEAGTLTPTEAETTSSTEKRTPPPAKMGSTRFPEELTATSTEERTTTSKVGETAVLTEIGKTSSTEQKRILTPTEKSTTISIEHSGSNNHSIIPEGTTSSVEDGTKTSTEEQTTSKQSDGIPTTPATGSFKFKPGFVSVETVKTAKTVLLASSIVISFMGILLNVPSLVVFRRMSASVSNTYIQILLFLDTVCLVFNFPMVIVEIFYRDVFHLPLYYAYFKIYCGMLVVIATRNVLIILTALMTLDRTLAVMFSMKKSQCCSWLSYPKTIAGVVMLLALAGTSTDGAFRLRIEEYVDDVSGNVYGVIRPTSLFENHMKEFVQVYLVVSTLFQFWTVAVMIVSNVALLVSLIRHDRFMQRAGVHTTNQSVLRRANTFRSVKVVLLYSFVFTLLTLPVALLHVVQIARPELKSSQGNLHTIFEHVLPFLDVISSGADFFVFFAMNSAFRDGFRSLFC